MNERTKRGIRAIEAALLLGILGDGLLRARPWGLNILLWTGAVITAIVVLLARRRRHVLAEGGHWLMLTALLFAAGFGWRDSPTLNFLAGVCLLIALALMAWRSAAGRTWRSGITQYVLGTMLVGANTFFAGFPILLAEVGWKEIPRTGWLKNARGVVLGVIIALPLLVLFGGLLMSADAGFERIIGRIFMSDHEDIVGHVLLTLFLTWIAGGFLQSMLYGTEIKTATDEVTAFVGSDKNQNTVAEAMGAGVDSRLSTPRARSLGIVEIGTTLALLNILFLVFVLLQLRYLFGDANLVQDSDVLTYAQYYRRGFFELVIVALLVLPILLGAHWLLEKGDPTHRHIFRLLAGMQVMLVFVIMVSAVRRMLLYQSEYGLTELRLYTTAFIAWLGLVFVWFIVTVLRGRRDQFACGALIAGFLIVATLHVMNPDALIVRVNVAHAQAGRDFDAHYASSLSADGIPALMESLPLLNAEDRRTIIRAKVLGSRSLTDGVDWRTWNWSRARARAAVRNNMDVLREISDSPRDIER